MPQIFKSQVLLILLIASTFSTANHHKIRHHHKHRHKQVIAFDSNELNEIREAFDDYRKIVQYKDKISEEAIPHRKHHEQNTLNDEEETMPAQSNSNAMMRHKRVHTTTARPTSTTNLPKSDNNYDELYDDDDNGQPNDDANVHSRRSSQVSFIKVTAGGLKLVRVKFLLALS